VSVVVPVRNRRLLLRGLLAALDAQTMQDFEVVVVDNCSSDGSGDEAASAVVAGRPVRVVRGTGGTSGAARDTGVVASSAAYLAFTDSDCVPAADWLENGTNALDGGADLVQGSTRPTRPVRLLERSVWVAREDGLYATCNMFVRRSSYDAAGGFEQGAERLRFRQGSDGWSLGFGTDSLFGWRVKRAGPVVFLPAAFVEHHVFEPDLRDSVSRAWMVKGFPALVREVPELRGTLLRHRVLLGDGARLGLYAAALLGLLRRKGLAATALGLWAAARLRRHDLWTAKWRTRVAAAPIVLALDAVQGAALVVGSVETRTVVL
jgi:glycosyltransferase involved in cell wall biosynthesis